MIFYIYSGSVAFFLVSVDAKSPLLVVALYKCSSDDGMREKPNLSAIHMVVL